MTRRDRAMRCGCSRNRYGRIDRWISVARTDPDMAAIRGLPAFEELLRGAEAVFRAGSK